MESEIAQISVLAGFNGVTKATMRKEISAPNQKEREHRRLEVSAK